jgi:feruloyl esterase
MTPVKNSKGEVVYAYPYIPGTETEWAPWNFAAPRRANMPPPHFNYTIAHEFPSYLAYERPRRNVDPLKFDFDRDPATFERARKIYDATSHDLRAFKARGGKMLMWHGLAHGGIMATSSIAYYDAVVRFMGDRKQTEAFFRLFLIPGVHHCQDGPGPSEFDALTLLENWVEKGQAPEVLMTERTIDGVVERTRPVYPYPIQARYSGQGDPKQASSFVPFDRRP